MKVSQYVKSCSFCGALWTFTSQRDAVNYWVCWKCSHINKNKPGPPPQKKQGADKKKPKP